jgi:hypothetical protein
MFLKAKSILIIRVDCLPRGADLTDRGLTRPPEGPETTPEQIKLTYGLSTNELKTAELWVMNRGLLWGSAAAETWLVKLPI